MNTFLAVFTITVAVTFAQKAHAQDEPCLKITTPAEASAVGSFTQIEGSSCDPNLRVWVVVQAVNYPADCWVQPEAFVDPATGDWSSQATIGDNATPAGEPYRIVAVADLDQAFDRVKVGCWPRRLHRSSALSVTKN